jgi:adenylate cyclase
MFKITFHGTTTTEAELEQESTLLAAAAKSGAELTHRCGGHARCGTCRITVVEGAEHLSEPGTAESRILQILKATPDQRLACQAWAKGEVCCKVEKS